MVIQFTIGNFLSFKEQSILSLAASALKEVQVPAEDIIFSVGTAGLSLMMVPMHPVNPISLRLLSFLSGM